MVLEGMLCNQIIRSCQMSGVLYCTVPCAIT